MGRWASTMRCESRLTFSLVVTHILQVSGQFTRGARLAPHTPMTPGTMGDLVPENATQELKRAYNSIVELGTVLSSGQRRGLLGLEAAVSLYLRAMDGYRMHSPASRLASERWARAARHLAEALWHEAKIGYLKDRTAALPYLTDALSEYHLHHETEQSARALIETYGERQRQAPEELGVDPAVLMACGRAQLAALMDPLAPRHELLSAERIKAANQYGRALECILLALESEREAAADASASQAMANDKAA